MPDKFGWCSVEVDGPPKQAGWYLITDYCYAAAPGQYPWVLCVWSGEKGEKWEAEKWESIADAPKFYFQIPGKEALSIPKLQLCPVCGSEPKLCTDGPPYYVMCGKDRVHRVCLIGPDASSKVGAIALWNALRTDSIELWVALRHDRKAP